MTTAKTYKSPILASVHAAMADAHDLGIIDQTTMREFDETCLTEIADLSAKEILSLRRREGISQAVLARYMNVATKLVGEWERGEKKPSGPSLKLLALIKAKGVDAVA